MAYNYNKLRKDSDNEKDFVELCSCQKKTVVGLLKGRQYMFICSIDISIDIKSQVLY